ncbi:hypothetical protein BC828DRAFT_381050 [Blastocladiella britannica]|nr:hypothetical protein BC828DRAFT_381050 [Blastocladiella britannica]
MRASTTPLLALIALLALLTASATAAATPAVSGAVLARATDVPGTDPTTETKNLQVWKKKVNGCEAPPVVKNVDTKVFRVVIEQPDAKKIGQIAALMAQEFVELQLALRASCNAFNTLTWPSSRFRTRRRRTARRLCSRAWRRSLRRWRLSPS